MTDFLSMLGIAPKAPKGPVPAPEGGTAAAADAAPPTPHAVEVDEWTARRGRELLNESGRMKRLLGTEADAPHAAADLYGMAFEIEPELTPACDDPARLDYCKRTMGSAGYAAMHDGAAGDELMSEMAAMELAEGWAKYQKAEAQHGKPKKGEKPGARKAREARLEAMKEAAAAAAVEKAAEEMEAGAEAMRAMGVGPGGMGPGSEGGRMCADRIREAVKKAATNPVLRHVFEMAGRFRRVARAKQKAKAGHGVDEVVGVRPGDDVPRLLPHEIALLDDPVLGDEAMMRLVEKRMLCWETRAPEPKARGPIIVCVDESGSMEGQKAEEAKALALAMAWIARQQKRWCALVAYSGDTGERLLALPPGRSPDPVALLAWITEFLGRGSYIDVPVREMPRIHADLKAPAGQTDVLFITDAYCDLPGPVQAAFLAWKKEAKARLFTLVVGGSGGGSLARVSDEIHTIGRLSRADDAVGRVLSI